MDKALLELRELSKFYTSAQSVVMGLDKVSLSFHRGEFVAITGESGSGKSTMAHVLAGVLPYEGGELLLGGAPTSHYAGADWEEYRRNSVSFISQSYGILPGNTVLSNVTTALRLVGFTGAAARQRAEEALKQVELWELRHRRAAKLSSGQKQRLSIARALARPAPILIADEPTGNLDAENSAKVIELLAQAAQDRLVILITHEFSECADCATRHISLHDGHVTMDQELRPPYSSAAPLSAPQAEKNQRLGLSVAGLQLRARPIWAALMTLLFTMTVFAFFAMAGTFVANLDDTSTRKYDNSAFRNGDDRRIVAVRPDGADMTEADHAALAAVDHVRSVEPWGYVTDIRYAWRESTDYYWKTKVEGIDPNYYVIRELSLISGAMPYVATVPVLSDGTEFLTAGRMPEELYEVVAVGDESMIGEILPVFFQDPNRWGGGSYFKANVQVVGVTDYGSGLYFSGEMGRMLTSSVMYGAFYFYGTAVRATFRMSSFPSVSTVDIFADRNFISAGRLPEALDEIVVQGGEERLGEELFISFEKDTGNPLVNQEDNTRQWKFTVVGVTNYSTQRAYFHEDVGLLFYDDQELADFQAARDQYAADWAVFSAAMENYNSVVAQCEQRIAEYDGDEEGLAALKAECEATIKACHDALPYEPRYPQPSTDDLVAYLSLLDDQIALTKGLYNMHYYRNDAHQTFPLPCVSMADKNTYDLTCVGYHDSTLSHAFMLSYETYQKMSYRGGSDQVTLIMEDYAYTDRVLEAVKELGYAAISPYRECSTVQDPALVEQRMQTLRICLIALVIALVLQVVVLRAMFSLENDTYRLMKNIGLDRRSAKRSVFWQVLAFTLAGQLLGIGAILFCGVGIESVARLLRYLDLPMRLVLLAAHFLVCLLTSVWITHALEKKVYPDPAPDPDLDWSGMEAKEVEA